MNPSRRALAETVAAAAATVVASMWARYATESGSVGWITLVVGLATLVVPRGRPMRERLIDPFFVAGLVALLHLTAARLGWIPPGH
jgi:hypothetical protein